MPTRAQVFFCSRYIYKSIGSRWIGHKVAKSFDPDVKIIWHNASTTSYYFSDSSIARVIGRGRAHRIELVPPQPEPNRS